MNYIATYMRNGQLFLFFLSSIVVLGACKTNSGIDSTPVVTAAGEEKKTTVTATLHNQPLATIQKYIIGPKWKMVYSIGGLTGMDKKEFTDTYVTFSATEIRYESDGKVTEKPYQWIKTRDIYTGDSTYVITGLGQWKVDRIYNDTLLLADNHYDGYAYSFIPVKQ
jgi:hypothetical protein